MRRIAAIHGLPPTLEVVRVGHARKLAPAYWCGWASRLLLSDAADSLDLVVLGSVKLLTSSRRLDSRSAHGIAEPIWR